MNYKFIEDERILYYNECNECLRDILNKYYYKFSEFEFSDLDIDIMKKLGVKVDIDEIIEEFLDSIDGVDINDLEKMFYLTKSESIKRKIFNKVLTNNVQYNELKNRQFLLDLWEFIGVDDVLEYVGLLAKYGILVDRDFAEGVLEKASIKNNKLFDKFVLEKSSDGFIFKNISDKITYIPLNSHLSNILKNYGNFIEFPIDKFDKLKTDRKKWGNLGIYWDLIYIIEKLLEINPSFGDLIYIAKGINDKYKKVLSDLKEKNADNKKIYNYKALIERVISKYIGKLKECENKLDLSELELIDTNPIKNILEFCKNANELSEIRDILEIDNTPLNNYCLIKKNKKIESLSVNIKPLPKDMRNKLEKILNNDIEKLVPHIDNDRIYHELMNNNNFKIDDLVFMLGYEKDNFKKLPEDIKNKSTYNRIKCDAPYYAEEYSFISEKYNPIIRCRDDIKSLFKKLNLDKNSQFKIENTLIFSKYLVFDENGNIYHLKDNISESEVLELIKVLIDNNTYYIENKESKKHYLKTLIELFEKYPQELKFEEEYIVKFIKLCYDYDKDIKKLNENWNWKNILRKSLCINNKLIKDYYVDTEDYGKRLSLENIDGKLIITKEDWEELMKKFNEIGIQKSDVNVLFDSLFKNKIYNHLINKLKSNGNLTKNDFEFLFNNDERFGFKLFDEIKSNAPYYIPGYSEDYSFLKNIKEYLPEILIENKDGFLEYVDNCDEDIEINGELIILKEPKLVKSEDIGKLHIYHLKDFLNDEEKKQLIDFICKKFQEGELIDCHRFKIYINKGEFDFRKIFEFFPIEKVYPNKYALNDEKVPEWLSEWINEDSKKQEFLFRQFRLNTVNSPVVKLRRYYIGEEKINKLGNLLNECLNKDNGKEDIFNTILWLKENRDKIKRKRWNAVKRLYGGVKDEILNKYINDEIFIASKLTVDENNEQNKIYDFKRLDELLWADSDFYYGKFKDKVWFLECGCFKDNVDLISQNITKELDDETSLKSAQELDDTKYIGYKKLKEILKKDLNLELRVYEVGKKLRYKLILTHNNNEFDVKVNGDYYLAIKNDLIEVYVDRCNSAKVEKALKSENVIEQFNGEKKYYNLVNEIVDEYDEESLEDKILQILNRKIDESEEEEELEYDESEEEEELEYDESEEEENDKKRKDTTKNTSKGKEKINNKGQQLNKSKNKGHAYDGRKDNGYKAESIAFKYLCEYFFEKIGKTSPSKYPNPCNISHNNVKYRIEWLNECNEDNNPYDIIVYKNGKEYGYFEVKSSDSDYFTISKNQCNFMKKHATNYYIIKIKWGNYIDCRNLGDAIDNGEIQLKSLTYHIK